MSEPYERIIERHHSDTLAKLRHEKPTPAEIVKGYQIANTNYHRTVSESRGNSGDAIAWFVGVRDAHATYAAEIGVDLNADYGQEHDMEALAYARMIALAGRSKENVHENYE